MNQKKKMCYTYYNDDYYVTIAFNIVLDIIHREKCDYIMLLTIIQTNSYVNDW